MPVYDVKDALHFIKKMYPWIPYFVIRRVLCANDGYMHKVGIMDIVTKLSDWKHK